MDVAVGSIVRVPLSGRRVRGWVVEVDQAPERRLKEVAGVSSAIPVFDTPLLSALRWAATHYVAPLSILLAKASPPNLPKSEPPVPSPGYGPQSLENASTHPLEDIATAVAQGKRRPTQAIVAPWQRLNWLAGLAAPLRAGRSVVVVAATAAEVQTISEEARRLHGDCVVEVSADRDSEITKAWSSAQTSGRLLVGTPRVAAWLVAGLSLVIVLEEGRRAMKDRQTPTVHVRDLLRTRTLIEGFTLVLFGPTPSVEALSAGAEPIKVGNRAWPLVEVVDRSDEPPGSGLIAERVAAALRAVTKKGGTSFAMTTHRMSDDVIAEINARLGTRAAGHSSAGLPVVVGTERDLANLTPVDLTVASNPDGMLLAPGYRTSEEALRQLARLANMLRPGGGHRMMVQTLDPGSSLVETLRRGDPLPYLESILVERARTGMPPSTEMMAIEIRGQIPGDVASVLEALTEVELMGPLEIDNGRRWLLQGDLRAARSSLRSAVGRWRSEETQVRIDADPIDL